MYVPRVCVCRRLCRDVPAGLPWPYVCPCARVPVGWRTTQVRMRDQLVKLSVLGQGASGKVYKAVHMGELKLVAAKVIPVFDPEKRAQMIKELTALYQNFEPLRTYMGAGGRGCGSGARVGARCEWRCCWRHGSR